MWVKGHFVDYKILKTNTPYKYAFKNTHSTSFWCHSYHQTVYILLDPDLTAQSAIRLDMKGLIQHI